MNPLDRSNLRNRLVELYFGCSSDASELGALIASDAAVRALYDEVKAECSLIEEAAKTDAPKMVFRAPAAGAASAPKISFYRSRRFAMAAALLVLVLGAGLYLPAFLHQQDYATLQASTLRVVLQGPSSAPDGTPLHFYVNTWSAEGALRPATVNWFAYDADKKLLASGVKRSMGLVNIEIPAETFGVRSIAVKAFDGDDSTDAEIELTPEKITVLAHLTSDKPIYRLGETAWLRGVFLERQTLAPRTGTYRLRVVDPKGVAVYDQPSNAVDGVVTLAWTLEGNGGRWAFEVRDADNIFTIERREFLVQAFEAPKLAKKITLDRESYAPAEPMSIEVSVRRIVEKAPAAGSELEASLIVDGRSVWTQKGALDADGRALLSCTTPRFVERGDARIVATIRSADLVETEVRPFVIDVGRVSVKFYPEGGDLVPGVENRIYFEAMDALERPASVKGKIVDGDGREVAAITTLHQNRGRFQFRPEEGKSYRFVADDKAKTSVDLPKPTAGGVLLRVNRDSFAAGEPVRLVVRTPTQGPWIAGVFCRGVLVGQTAWQGAGSRDVEVPLAPTVAGVLRVTIFDRATLPVAERLVHRASGRKIGITINPKKAELAPGESQEVEIQARDESGAPVRGILGVTVSDKAVRDFVGEHRVGLADQTWFVADAEELERVEEFLGGDDVAALNIDLVLGTRGWRRFIWKNAVDLLGDSVDKVRRVLAREGALQIPIVDDSLLKKRELLAYAARSLDRSWKTANTGTAIFVGLIALCAIGATAASIYRRSARPAFGLGLLGSVATVVAVALVFGRSAGTRDLRTFDGDPGARPMATASSIERSAGIDPMPLAFDAINWADGGRILSLGLPESMPTMNLFAATRLPEVAVRQIAFGPPRRGGRLSDADRLREKDALVEELVELKMKALDVGRAALAREYAHRPRGGSIRDDFTETVYFNGLLSTDAEGRATASFATSDRVTTWSVDVDAHGAHRVGQASAAFTTRLPFSLDFGAPAFVTQGDSWEAMVGVEAIDPNTTSATVTMKSDGAISLRGDSRTTAALSGGRGRARFVLSADKPGIATVQVMGEVGAWADSMTKTVVVLPRGYPHRLSRSGIVGGKTVFEIGVPESYAAGTLEAHLRVFPSVLADLQGGLEAMIAEPHGCFEQVSSTNYPNVLALTLLKKLGQARPEISRRAEALLADGYRKLTAYECKTGGFEWWGHDPGHIALTAFGLLEFTDMAAVYDVDKALLERTRAWLLAQRDGEGGFKPNFQGAHWFGNGAKATSDVYVTYALLAAGVEAKTIDAEVKKLIVRALESDDAYQAAVGALGLAHTDRKDAAEAARNRLKTMLDNEGAIRGAKASVVGSGERDLTIEATAYAALAWLADPDDLPYARRAVDFLLSQRQAGGSFGATHATVLALRALCEYATAAVRQVNACEVVVHVDGVPAHRLPIAAQQSEVVDLGAMVTPLLKSGVNRISLFLDGGNEFPWVFDLAYRSATPASDPECRVAFETTLATDEVREGCTIALSVTAENRTKEALPMATAVVGIPAGLDVDAKVLDALKDAGRFEAWELRGQDLVLYWTMMKPEETRQATIELIARRRGHWEGNASRAYLYYSPESTAWSKPLAVRVIE